METALYAGAAVATAGLTWLARRYALARRLVDQPGARRSHQTVTPRGGGIAIVVVVLLALLWSGSRVPHGAFVALAASGLVLVAGVGWWDDHRPLSARLRLAVHVAAALLLATGLRMSGVDGLACAAIFVAAVVLINVWNFMDGINGLAVSQAGVVAATAAILAGREGMTWPLAWVLVAACAGFLPFNFPRARIFLGDVGSGALGYLLAMLAGLMVLDEATTAVDGQVVLLLLPAGAFLVDATLTLGRRILRGERWWQPHVQHAYQSLARRRGHVPTTLAYGLWSLTGMLVACGASESGWSLGFMIVPIVAAWQGLGALWWWYLQDSEQRMTERGPRA